MTEIIHDVFISHAFEDKNDFTNDLAHSLKEKGLKVWYSGFELKLGDSIANGVNNALKSSKYAVVVISPVYLEKTWAMNELQAIFAQEQNHKRILPILHHITIDEIKKHLPLIADRYAISTQKGLEFILNNIMEVIRGGNINGDFRNKYSETSKKKVPTKTTLLNPVLLPLGVQRTILKKMFPDPKSIIKKRKAR
jgi:hypothetical protein